MTASYFGYIMKLEVNCSNGPSNSGGRNFCVVFKAKGNHTCKGLLIRFIVSCKEGKEMNH